MNRRTPWWVTRGLALAALLAPPAGAQKTDLLRFHNGDNLTVEFLVMERGKLRVKTHGLGTIEIEWDRVARLVTDKRVDVEILDGSSWVGTLVDSGQDGQLRVVLAGGDKRVPTSSVVFIRPVRLNFFERLEGYVSAGASAAQANSQLQANFGLQATYRMLSYDVTLSATGNVTDQANQEQVHRNEVSLSYTRYLAGRWFGTAVTGLQRNDELGLDLRTYLGLGIGHRILQREDNYLSAVLGLSAVNEQASGAPDSLNSLESVASLDYQVFSFRDPDLDVKLSYSLIPSLTESGRLRTNLDLRLLWGFLGDFDWEFKLYHATDNQPISVDAQEQDYGLVTSLVYSF